MDRRAFLAALAAAGAGAALPLRAATPRVPGNPSLSSGLAGPTLVFDSFGAPDLGVLDHGGRGVLKGRGLTAVHVGLVSPSFEAARAALTEWERRFRRQPEELVKILAARDIERSSRQGRLGILLGFANVACVDDNVDNLYALYAAGARVIQITDEPRDLPRTGHPASKAGLSDFVVGAVETMNELGMVVDLSLCGEATSRHGIQISRKPPAFTHASCRAIHPRGHAKSDALLRAMAERGGMIGIHPGDDRSSEEHLDHITHAVNAAGIDHVGIASSSGASSPRSLVSFLTLALGLESRRYRAEDVEKVLGGNWNRYLREAL